MSVLDDIIARKRTEVTEMKADQAILDAGQAAQPSERSLVTALRSRERSLILEVKPRSPSAGELLQRSAVPHIVDFYNQFAEGISVLCDEPDFGGGYDLLREVRDLSDKPLLAKEFIVDPIQVQYARACGADAILLIAAVLTADEIAACSAAATALSMAVLFELHDAADLAKVPELTEEQLILGINNRNLRDLSIDLVTTETLAPVVREQFPSYLLLSESGVTSAEDVEYLTPFVDGLLIGTGLLRNGEVVRSFFALFDS